MDAMVNDEARLRKFTEQVLDCRQHELENQESENNKLLKRIEALEKELAEARERLSPGSGQSQPQFRQVGETRDHASPSQGAKKGITESQARDAYKRLVSNVRQWSHNRLEQHPKDLDFSKMSERQPARQCVRFISLMRDPAKRCMCVDRSDEFHVVAVIMNYIALAFFSKSFYCPLGDYTKDTKLAWVDEVERVMSRLPRDIRLCRDWRIDTLNALSSQKSFRERRSHYIDIVSQELATLLSLVTPETSLLEIQGSLRRNIIEPAADLAHELCLASNPFSLKWPLRSAWSRLEVYDCLDVSSDGSLLDLSGTTMSSPARHRVSYLFDVAPGLFVERIHGNKKLAAKAVCKPTVLVHAGGQGIVQGLTIMGRLSIKSLERPAARTPSMGRQS